MTGYQSPEAFCRSFEWSKPESITWSGSSGWIVLDSERRVNIKLTDTPHGGMGYVDHYYGFGVTIVSKTTGKIAYEGFAFDDFLEDSVDNRGDKTLKAGEKTFYGYKNRHDGYCWHIAVPTTTKAVTQAIEAFINLFH